MNRCVLVLLLVFLVGVSAAVCLRAQTAAPFSFVAIGDAGEPGAVVEAAGRALTDYADRGMRTGQPITTLLFLGDNFYPIGLNQPPEVQHRLLTGALDPFRPVMQRLGRDNVQAVAGNHEYYCGMWGPVPVGTCFNGSAREKAIKDWTYHEEFPASIRRAIANGSRDSVEIIMFDSGYILATPMSTWQHAFDSLDRLIAQSGRRAGVKWRIIATHHSPYTVGEHGGYRLWSERLQRVTYIGNCIDEGDDPFRYAYQIMSNSDNCHPEYLEYSKRLLEALDRSSAKIQLLLAGHDHSLQLLRRPVARGVNRPTVFVISGAGSKVGKVRSPGPPNMYTHPLNTPQARGASIAGFVAGIFRDDRLELEFINAEDAGVIDMGGAKKFVIDVDGEVQSDP